MEYSGDVGYCHDDDEEEDEFGLVIIIIMGAHTNGETAEGGGGGFVATLVSKHINVIIGGVVVSAMEAETVSPASSSTTVSIEGSQSCKTSNRLPHFVQHIGAFAAALFPTPESERINVIDKGRFAALVVAVAVAVAD